MPRLTLSEQVTSLQSQLASAQSLAASLEQQNSELIVQNNAFRKELETLRPLPAQVDALIKERDQHKSYYSSADNDRSRLREEQSQLHMILDAVEGAPARYIEAPPESYRSKEERSLTTRLAGTFLALSKTFSKLA